MSATEIHYKMAAILSELPAIGKSERNEQQQFMFRGHDQVLNALNPLLAKHGVYATPMVLDRVTAQRQTRSGGVMYEVNLHVKYTFYASDGSSISASAWGEGTDSGDKSTNKAMTMAFKNVLNQVFAINTQETQNLDTDRGHPEETVARQDPVGDPTAGSVASPGSPVPQAGGEAEPASPTGNNYAPPPEVQEKLDAKASSSVPTPEGYDGSPESCPIDFGKHKGKRMGDVPRAYQEWLASDAFEPQTKEKRLQKNCAIAIIQDKPVAVGVVADDDIPFAASWA
jgi:hypothetical protein